MSFHLEMDMFTKLIAISLLCPIVCGLVSSIFRRLHYDKFASVLFLIGWVPIGLFGIGFCLMLLFSFVGVFLNGAAFTDNKTMVSIMTLFTAFEGYQCLIWVGDRKNHSRKPASVLLIVVSVLYLIYTGIFIYPIYQRQDYMLGISQFLFFAVLLLAGIATLHYQVKSRKLKGDDIDTKEW